MESALIARLHHSGPSRYDTNRFDTSWISRGVNSFSNLAYRTRNLHPICFSCSRANYTLSDRNCCAVSVFKFVSKRLCIEMTCIETTSLRNYFVWKRPVSGQKYLQGIHQRLSESRTFEPDLPFSFCLHLCDWKTKWPTEKEWVTSWTLQM